MKIISVFSMAATVLMLSSCGGGGGSSSVANSSSSSSISSSGNGVKVGYLHDSPIAGINYECGTKADITDDNGKFECDTFPVLFKVGNLEIGTLSSMTADSIIFPQDLLGLDRKNETNTELIKLVQFLQGLDDDGNISKRINITAETRAKFSSDGDSKPGDGGLSGEAKDAGIPLPSPATAMNRLRQNMDPDADAPADTSNISPYAGDWVGSGAGWEVRFKHTSGDFVSQFSGADKDALPFSGEKIIMSLMVEHENTFTLHVDNDGKITGEGYITYNLIPNLCGLDALVTQVNSAVNMLSQIEFFFTLGAKIGAASVEKFVEESSHFGNSLMDTALAAYNAGNTAASVFGQDVGSQLLNKAKKMSQDGKNSAGVCHVAAGVASYGGGNKIGPVNLQELVKGSGLDIAKTLIFDLQNPLGMMLSIPGITQVQYYYKGLQNGPELRYYTISGHISGDGKMYLEVDQMEEPFDLIVEWQVNYKTETGKFRVWSPFLDNGATIFAANHKNVTYDYVTKMETKSYVDHADGNKVKTVQVPIKELQPKERTLPMPSASFREAGSQRNNVSVWHEYEYEWNAYKVSK